MEAELKEDLLVSCVGSVSFSRHSRHRFKDRVMKAVIAIKFALLLFHQHGSQEDDDNDENPNGVIREEKFFSATTSFDNQMQLDNDSAVTPSISIAISGEIRISIGEQVENDISSEDSQNSRSVNDSREGTTSFDNQMQLPDDSSVSSSIANPGPISSNSTVQTDDLLNNGLNFNWQRRITISRKDFIMLIAAGNVIAEVVSLTFEQLGGQQNFHVLLIRGVMVLVSLILCLIEIHIKDEEEAHCCQDILGLLFAVSQFVVIVIGGILLKTTHKNPVQVSFCSFILAAWQLVLKIVVRNKDDISPQNDGTV